MSETNKKISYEVVTQEDTATGDVLIPLPPELLQQLGWSEGTQVKFEFDDKGRFIVSRA